MIKRYRVWLRSVPGFYEQYDGTVDCTVESDPFTDHGERGEVFLAAVRELRRTAFPDRVIDCWRLERYEVLK